MPGVADSINFGHWDNLFTFLEPEGVEPTNNVSERALRLFVLIRKITYGNRSAKGEIALARLLTVTSLGRQDVR